MNSTSNQSSVNATKYAGFLVRLLALVLDGIILGIIGYAIFGKEVVQIDTTSGFSFSINFNGWKSVIPPFYTLLFWILFSATPGKLICRLKIVDTDGKRLSWQKALIRFVSYIPSAFVFFLGFIWVGFDSKKQGWHDKIAKTYVIKR